MIKAKTEAGVDFVVYTYAEEIALTMLDKCADSDGAFALPGISARVIRHLIKKLEGKEKLTKYEKRWAMHLALDAAARATGKVAIRPVGKKAYQVVAPFSETFRVSALAVKAVWKPRTKVWSFRTHTYEQVVALCKEHYPAEAFEL